MDKESNHEAITSSPVSISASNNHAFAASEGTNVRPVEPRADSGAPSVEPMAAREAVTGLKLAVVIASVALACFLMLIDTMVISTAIPRITDEFGSLPDIGWYASAYQFGSAAPQPLAGKVFTYFPIKWSFLVFFGIFELGSLLCGVAASSKMLIVGRAIAGIGGAGIINGAIMIISSCVPLEKRPALIGVTVGFAQLGLALGPIIGGALTSYSTWRWCFYMNLPIGGVAALAIVLLSIPEHVPKPLARNILFRMHRYFDLLGFFLFAVTVLLLLLALQYGGNAYRWNSPQVIGLLCGSAAGLIVWLCWNHYRGEEALIPASMVRQRTVWVAGLFNALFMGALYGSIYFLPIYFQAINNASAIRSGVYLLPTILPELLMAVAAGALLQKLGYVIPLAIVSIVFLSVGSGLCSLLRPNSPTGWWVGFQVIAGMGSGLGLNLAINAVQAVVMDQELPSAMAFIGFTQSLGPAIFLVLYNVLFGQYLRSQIPSQVPGADVEAIVAAGATQFRAILEPGQIAGVIIAYANSIDRVFYLIAAVAAACGVVLWGLGWKDLRKKVHTSEGQEVKSEANDDTPGV